MQPPDIKQAAPRLADTLPHMARLRARLFNGPYLACLIIIIK